MNPGMLTFLAVMLPVLLLLLLFGPIYAGMCAGLYFYYGPESMPYFYNPLQVVEVYSTLYDYWQANKAALTFRDFLLPAFGPLLGGVMIGFFLLWWFIRYIRNIFLLSSP